MESLIAANTTFSLDLFKKINEIEKKKNIFFSPMSISSALSMLYMGAEGNTAVQMSEVLGFAKEKKPEACPKLPQQQQHVQTHQFLGFHKAGADIHAGFKNLMSELNKEGAPYALSLANRLYGDQSFEFEKKYIMGTKQFYQAELETVDFKSNAEGARVKINSWVEEQTQEKIKDLLAEGIVDALTTLVLVNAIYFKGNWANQFKANDTGEQQFKLNKNESTPVQMMSQTAVFRLGPITEVNCQILEMPYVGQELSMFIILPQEIEDDSTGLERLEKALTYDKLCEWTQPDKMEYTPVNVALPKFKMEETYDLNNILKSMGMEDAFDTRCNLSGISSSSELVVSNVVHKSFVAVDEKGTEAAAATAVVMGVLCARPPPNYFTADHPFLFFIRHNATKSILFFGRFCSP